MKKLTRFIAGFSAAAALLLGVGCTNQADYVEDNTARNACNIEGLYVEGLDKAYDGNVFELHAVVVNEKGEAKSITEASDGKVTDDTVAILTGTVADSYTKDSKTVGHKSGTIYKTSADNKRLFDGDSMAVAYQRSQIAAGKTGTDIKTFAAGTLEFYLKVGNDYVFGTKKNSAGNIVPLTQKLSIPTSPAGTSDAALQSRWVKVVIANGVPTATLEKKVDEPVNVTLACISLDLLPKTEAEIEALAGVEIKKTAKAGTNQKFTVTITGLESNNGIDVVFGGADISDTDTGTFKDDWYDTTKHKKTITDGKVSFEFYGKAVNGGNIGGWNRTYTAAGAGPEIVIASVNEKKQDGPRLLTSPTSREGNTKSTNFMFPAYCIGDFDVELTIDKSKLDSTSVTQADPVVAAAEIKINAIYVANLASATETSKYYLTASDDPTSSRKFLANEKNGTLKELLEKWSPADAAAFACAEKGLAYTFAETVNVKPGQSTFVLGFRAVPPKATDTDADSYDWDNNVAFETPTLLTESYADGKEYTLYADAVTGVINLIETSKVNFGAFPLNISKIYLKGFANNVPGDATAANPVKPTIAGAFNNCGNKGTDNSNACPDVIGTYDAATVTWTYDYASWKTTNSSNENLKGAFPGAEFKFRNNSAWKDDFGVDGKNAKWPVVVGLPVDITCTYKDGNITVTWTKAN
ncbi:MAG: hypothetical protein IJJ71_03660 [Treponema sp.]|uniref:hypothetical protein n=1 Tax=Treponema sp. TaxID=166 RepID=UPI0025D7FCD1|nr:hypothetical protein [Treponema sp.]MBR0495258.1 hypothetical protein [Treponema sp.]